MGPSFANNVIFYVKLVKDHNMISVLSAIKLNLIDNYLDKIVYV
jgi:hypothetical protein